MGRFKAEATIVRELGEITIIFYDSQSIYVFDKTGHGVIFHRWFAPRGSYGTYWRDFRRRMLRRKNLTMVRCHEIAAEYDIQSVCATYRPKLDGRKIVFRA